MLSRNLLEDQTLILTKLKLGSGQWPSQPFFGCHATFPTEKIAAFLRGGAGGVA